jgi:(1->4)-alpha-D-glucan 1-alpha-D-glucosylmutase
VLEKGEIKLAREAGDFTIRYFDRSFPVAARSLDSILARAAQRCGNDELAFIADSLTTLPFATDTDAANRRRRQRDIAVLKAAVGRLIQSSPDTAAAIDESVAAFNADHDLLHGMLERQNYRLAFWRAAGRDLGYRRFFDINSLIGLRMENEEVFNDTHSLVLRWLLEGVLDGVRIDHIDGLRDPYAYLQRLSSAAPKAWIVVEKILQAGEHLRESWPVAGTTGYDFLNRATGLLVNPAGEAPLTRLYVEFTGQSTDYPTLSRACKEMVARDVLGSELNRLTELFVEVCENDRRHRDFTRHELHEALVAVVTRFAVYRTYCQMSGDPSPEDVRYVDEAIAQAKSDETELDPELFDFLGRILLLREGGQFHTELALSFQQFTGPVMAKALEDTAFYRYHRLICLNEVGGDPSRFGISTEEFHRACLEGQRRLSTGLLATSTHDTKRSEDVRARIALLSEIPAQWSEVVGRWSVYNRVHWQNTPDRNAEYLLYQTLVGAWPINVERAWSFMNKATREAKLETSWTKPNSGYENNLRGFVENVIGDTNFISDLEAFVAMILPFARINSLTQTLVKLTSPGIPDMYQGTELWDLSLVDPDNRRPVDYALRRRLLQVVKCSGVEEIVKRADEGLPKLWLIYQTLSVRRRHPELFGPESSYEPLAASGRRAGHVVAFMRAGGAITVVPRLVFELASRWEDTALDIPVGKWRNELDGGLIDGGRVGLAGLTAKFPVCLLIREEPKR